MDEASRKTPQRRVVKKENWSEPSDSDRDPENVPPASPSRTLAGERCLSKLTTQRGNKYNIIDIIHTNRARDYS